MEPAAYVLLNEVMKEIREVKRDLVEILDRSIDRSIDVERTSEYEGVFTSKEAATYLGIGLNSFYELCSTKEFPSFKVGSKIIIPKRKLNEWIEKQTKKEGLR